MQNYLKAYAQVMKKLKKKKNNLITFEPGQMLDGDIVSVNETTAELKLDGDIKGYISKYHSQGIGCKSIFNNN